jgi:hypothetical protein
MEEWKQSLDRYLTREPNADFNNWCEKVADSFSHAFWIKHEDWLEEYDGTYNKWLIYLYDKEYTIKKAAVMIERMRLYQLKIK